MSSGTRLRSAYAAAGVDVAAGERTVELLKERIAESGGPSGAAVLSGIGAFASAVTLPPGYREPVLVSATDGVGTKTALAAALGRHDTIGRDLVAMCADDVVCAGARPFLFLDYVAVGRLEPETVASIVAGIADGCELAGCALVGGETAEHPGLLAADQFDVAGFCLGIVEREDVLDVAAARPGDALIGLASSGLHANGYSLVRAMLARDALGFDAPYRDVVRDVLGEREAVRVAHEEPDTAARSLGDVLLTPSQIYARDLLSLRDALNAARFPLRAVAHITGGGLPGNVPRALPAHLAARIDTRAWPTPSIFRLIAALGGLDGPQLRATFNAGLGMVAVVPPRAAEAAIQHLAGRGVQSWVVGSVIEAGSASGERYVENGSVSP